MLKKNNNLIEHKPWGTYEVLSDESDYKVKKILVYPKKRLSLQLHHHRSEHWYIVSGKGLVTLSDDKIQVEAFQSVNIPVETVHRIENTSNTNLVFIEIQTGDYFGEDDIERFEDDYNRI